MRISRIEVHNFRNFCDLDLHLGPDAVIVGENKVGKSNLLHALRLVLDPSLPDSSRQLREEDFWDGLPRPLTKNDRILISIEFADFEDNEDNIADLNDHLIESDPMVARLTYVFQALSTLEGEPVTGGDYEFFIYGGDDPENKVNYEVRRRLPLDVLGALRDAEGDLANWRRSPLRPLLENASRTISRDSIEEIADKISETSDEVAKIKEIHDLTDRINARLQRMVGSNHALETALGFSPTDPERLLRALRLFIDGRKRTVAEASVGSANLLYLTLKLLELEQLVAERSRDHTFFAIEEPEAHLHPHLQRLVFRDLLRPRPHQEGGNETENDRSSVSILLTTHSPHIASVTPLRSIALLRKCADLPATEGVSAASVELSNEEIDDLERYLDVSRGEMLFARGVILVEGDAEVFLLPKLARLMDINLDAFGITVCSVSGTNFAPYVKLLGPQALNIPFAVVTDGDPREEGLDGGEKRVLKLLPIVADASVLKKKTDDELLAMGPQYGLFLGEHTFEIDLFNCGRHKSMGTTIQELTENSAAEKRAEAWMKAPKSLDPARFIADIEAIGKGRFAQRLACRIKNNVCPKYIAEAIQYVASRCQGK